MSVWCLAELEQTDVVAVTEVAVSLAAATVIQINMAGSGLEAGTVLEHYDSFLSLTPEKRKR